MYKLPILCFVFSVQLGAQNLAPYTTGPQSIQTLPGQNTCLNIKSADDDPSDTVRISWNNHAGIPAIFINNNGSVQHAEGEICWTPTKADARLEPYLFFITLDDGHVQVEDTFSIIVHGIPERDSFRYERSACGERTFYSAFNEWVDAVSYKFIHQGTTLSYSTPVTQVTIGGLARGTYILETTVSSSVPIHTKYSDTFFVSEGYSVNSKLDTLPEPNQYRATLIENTGDSGIRYSWAIQNSLGMMELPDTLPEIVVQVWETSDLFGIASYDQNCGDTTVFTLYVDPNSVQEIEKPARIYPNPCSNQLHIESDKPISCLTLFDIQGKPVLQKEEAEELATQLDVAGLPRGTYFLAIHYADYSVKHHAVVIR